MSFFHTSKNVKILRDIMLDYVDTENISPHEYMEFFIEKYPENIDSCLLQWIMEIFLDLQNHIEFLENVVNSMSTLISNDNHVNLIIYFHALTFQVPCTNRDSLYKSMFNVSKQALQIITKYLTTNNNLTTISQIAEQNYDTCYVADKIINPLLEWQPYLNEMLQKVEEYILEKNTRKIKSPTVPVTPNVLKNRTAKHTHVHNIKVVPPNSLQNKQKMLSKDEIDKLLNTKNLENKKKATRLLNEVKNISYNFAQGKTKQYYEKIQSIERKYKQYMDPLPRPKKIVTQIPDAPVVDTITSIKRLNKCIQLSEEKEIKWLDDLMSSFKNVAKINDIEEEDRIERERSRKYDIERKHLLGQISHEEAVLAKMKLKEINKMKHENFIKEREQWNFEISKWRNLEMEKNRQYVENLSLLDLNVIKAKSDLIEKKKEGAKKIKEESQCLRSKMLIEKNDEMERKINIIKEMKIISMIATKANVNKIVDLTETSGLGLMCEMSIVELQERLFNMKINLKEEIENKREQIRQTNIYKKKLIEDQKEANDNYLKEKSQERKKNIKQKTKSPDTTKVNDEISNLRNILNEKRKRRLSLINK